MTNYTPTEGQNIFDVALQLYGDATEAFRILQDNPDIVSIDQLLKGTSVSFDENAFTSTTTFINTNGIGITTGKIETEVDFFDAGEDVVLESLYKVANGINFIDGSRDLVKDYGNVDASVDFFDGLQNKTL